MNTNSPMAIGWGGRLAGGIAIGLLLSAVPRSDAAPPDAAVRKPVTVVYDVRDLIAPPPDFRAEGSLVIPPVKRRDDWNQPPSVPVPDAAWRVPDPKLIDLLMAVVAPGTWGNGEPGRVVYFDGRLVVTHTNATQRAVKDFLDQLRTAASRGVTVRAKWMEQSSFAGRGAALGWAGAASRVRFAGQMSGHSGQTLHLGAGQAQTFVRNFMSTVGGGGLGGFVPLPQLVQDGLSLELTANLSADGRSAVVEVHCVNSEWIGHRPAYSTGHPGQSSIPDHLDMSLQQLRTTVALPVGKAVVIGGLTRAPRAGAGGVGGLYLVLEVLAKSAGGIAEP